MTDAGGKFAQGLRGFPTPDGTGDAVAYLLFLFGDNPAIAQTILGALEPLNYPDNWYQWGDMSTDDAAEYFRSIVEQAPYNKYDRDIQAPFWDEESGDDADDEASPETQDWYGTWDGETFTESLAYVFLTNFLSTLISTGAAIKFLTIPRAFRLLIRQNPHGANLLLFLDGGLYKVINGYSPVDKIAEFLIASPGTELLLVQDSTHDPSATPNDDGNYVVDVVRGRLAYSDVSSPDVRYTGDPPVYQTTTDDGTTWVDNPTADPRHSDMARFPPLTHYSGIECDTAARMSAQLKQCIQTMCDVADAAQAVTALLELILVPTGLVGLMIDLFFTICNWIIDNGQETILAAFTDAVYDDITCTLRCYIEPDGTITQTKLDQAWEQIKSDHAGTVATVIDEVRFLFTDVVFSNAGVKRTETGDCSGCDDCFFCHYIDLTVVDGSSEGVVISGGTWVSGSGIQGADFGANDRSDAYGYWAFGEELYCDYVKMVYTKTAGSGANNVNRFQKLNPVTNYTTTIVPNQNTDNTLGTNVIKIIDSNENLRGMGWDVNSGSNTTPVYIVGLEVRYRRSSPLWVENCTD